MPPDLLGEHRSLDEFRVLEAVADDRRIVSRQRDHGEEFRLAARLEPKAVRPAELKHLLDHLPLLIDLHRIDAAILTAVAVLLHRRGEHAMNLAQPVLQDLAEPQQDREVDAPQLQAVHQRLEVDALGRVFVGMHEQVPVGADGKIPVAPAGYLVELGGVRRTPMIGVEIDCHQ